MIPVLSPPIVEYWTETPELANRMPEMPDVFHDADEDLRPLTESWAEIMDQNMREGTAVTSTAPVAAWASGTPVAASTVPSTVTTTAALGAPIPTPVLDLAGERPASPTVIASTPGASQPELVTTSIALVTSAAASSAVAFAPIAAASMSQTDTHPVLRFSDIAYTVRLSRAGQADLVVDSLLAGFRTEHTRAELIFAARSMFALLRDVGTFLRERIVGARLAQEPLQGVVDDISGALDHFMGDDEHHQLA